MKAFRLVSTVFGLLLLAVSGAGAATAHEGSFTAKYVDGANVIVLNYNVPHDLTSGIIVIHNLRLYDLIGQPIPFQTVEAQFRRGGGGADTRTAGLSANNDVVVSYEYPKAGTYVLIARFIDHGKQISRAEFPLVVTQGPGSSLFSQMITLPTTIAFVVGLGAARLYSRDLGSPNSRVAIGHRPR